MKLTWSPLVGRGSGKAGDGVLTVWKGIQVLRQRVVPKNPKSTAQTTQRGHLARIPYLYRSLDADMKLFLNDLAAERGRMSGYNVFCKEDLKHLADGETMEVFPENMHVHPVEDVAASNGVGESVVTWSQANAVTGKYVTILYSDETEKDNIWKVGTVGIVTVQTETYTVTGLTAAHLYHIVVLVEGDLPEQIYSGGRSDSCTPT